MKYELDVSKIEDCAGHRFVAQLTSPDGAKTEMQSPVFKDDSLESREFAAGVFLNTVVFAIQKEAFPDTVAPVTVETLPDGSTRVTRVA